MADSVPVHGFVEVQDQVGDHRPGRELGRVERRRSASIRRCAIALLGGVGVGLVTAPGASPELLATIASFVGVGLARRARCDRRTRSAPSASCRLRSASARPAPRAASKCCTSFISCSACSGVLLRSRTVQNCSRFGRVEVRHERRRGGALEERVQAAAVQRRRRGPACSSACCCRRKPTGSQMFGG